MGMKKDIQIPEVKDVHIAAVQELHPDFKALDWNIYLINNLPEPLEMVIVVTKGFKDGKSTAQTRHQIKLLPAKSYAKIEWLQEDLLAINNNYSVSFFKDGTMYHRNFILKANKVKPQSLKAIPLLAAKGVLAD